MGKPDGGETWPVSGFVNGFAILRADSPKKKAPK